MNFKKTILYAVIFTGVFAVGWIMFGGESSNDLGENLEIVSNSDTEEEASSENNNDNDIDVETDEEPVSYDERIVQNMTFAAQAPLGNWSDPRQQDGCEETAALMAVAWARGETFTLQEAEDEIVAMSKFTESKYGEYKDTSARDTVEWIYKDYLNFNNVSLEYDITVDDIKRELYAGNVVVVPTNGQLLNNRHFTPPGPERHMFVIKGYDPATKEFIANDNGTRYGEGYRYTESIMASALMDYPTGYHEPIVRHRTAMIVISEE